MHAAKRRALKMKGNPTSSREQGLRRAAGTREAVRMLYGPAGKRSCATRAWSSVALEGGCQLWAYWACGGHWCICLKIYPFRYFTVEVGISS